MVTHIIYTKIGNLWRHTPFNTHKILKTTIIINDKNIRLILPKSKSLI